MSTAKTSDPVVKVSRDITEILNLSGALTAQAIQHARDRIVPGGYAMVSLAPVADPATYAARVDAFERRAMYLADLYDVEDRDEFMPELYADDGWEPPLQTLRTWTTRWRTVRDTEGPEHPTIETEAKFIRGMLTWATDNEPHWDAFAKDINTVRRRLENLLHAGNRPDRTRVVCDRETCPTHPQLIRIRDTRRTAAWACVNCDLQVPVDYAGNHCPNPWCHTPAPPRAVWSSNPDNDRWKCTACKTRFTDDDYRRAHAKQLRSQGAEKWVVLGDAIATLKTQGRSPASVREWLKPPEHVADQCTRCQRKYDPSEYPACPRVLVDPHSKQERLDDDGNPITCGGSLARRFYPDLDDIPEGYCELGTRRRYTWWPDLWRKHLTTQTRTRKASA